MHDQLMRLLAAPAESVRFDHWTAQVPHTEKSAEECEDAYAVGPDLLAVSDGASGTIGSRVWAEILVRSFVETRRPPLRSCGLAELAAEWRRAIEPVAGGEWFAREKVDRGAAATFLGLMLGKERWVATATGDSCLFLVRGDDLVLSFPVNRSSDFGDAPPLVYTGNASGKKLPQAHRGMDVVEGECLPGDVFILATDAVAAWFLARAESGLAPWRTLGQRHADGWFPRFVADQRASGRMENDDATIVVVEVGRA